MANSIAPIADVAISSDACFFEIFIIPSSVNQQNGSADSELRPARTDQSPMSHLSFGLYSPTAHTSLAKPAALQWMRRDTTSSHSDKSRA